MPISIHLKLFATLRRYRPENAAAYEVSSGATVAILLRNLEIHDNEVKLVFINGVRKEIDTPLSDGDRVGLFPPVGGG